uniref:RNA-dependent RNA polymerase n=1 Tax=Sclerotinia sclerotiorum mitovirus 6-A TaxID=2231689 RepID=A0A2Z4QKD9_9VIRU|nr:RNA-dependent RNA polymerase [Sclerotinia sclerotiorum mitovirus 6-A]
MKTKTKLNNSFGRKVRLELFSFAFKVVKWLCIASCGTSLPLHHFEALCNKLQRVLNNHSQDYTVKYIKAVRGNFYNYLSGNPLRNSLARSTSDGIPVVLGDLIPLVRGGDRRAIALVLTILTATRSLKFISEPDLTTVTQPVKGDVPDLSKHMASFWRSLGYKPITAFSLPRKLKVNEKVYRLSNGPNGRVLNTALLDIHSMPTSLKMNLSKMSPLVGARIRNFSPRVFSEFFQKYYKKFDNNKNCCRRLSCFPDKEGKMRVVGVVDNFSQLALKPLHSWLARGLSKIKQDCTLEQGKFRKLLFNGDCDIYYSVDLSAATDRFPISVIKDLLKFQLPHEYVEAWSSVMVDTPFEYRGSLYKYNAGNPMGAYSSFNSFALTHHYIIYYCCRELGMRWKSLPYALLGDDIVIGNAQVGELYMKIIKSLHVDYSLAKTHKSKDFFEFAKRIYYKGDEITPFPISSLKEVRKSCSALTDLLLEQKVRGWECSSIASSAELFYGIVLNLPSRLRKKLTGRVKTAEGVLSLVRGLQDGETFINELSHTLQLPLPHISLEICVNIISNIAVEVFSSSAIHTFFSDDRVNFPLKETVNIMRTEWDRYIEDVYQGHSSFEILKAKSFWQDTPINLAAIAIYNEYDELMKRIQKIDSTGSDWSYYMRNFAIPTSTKSIVEGRNFSLMRSVDRFASLIEERLQVLACYPQLLRM